MKQEYKARLENLIAAVEEEREEEERFYQHLAQQKTLKERAETGFLWYPVDITKKHYAIAEQVEIEVKRRDSTASSNYFKVGASAILFWMRGSEKTEYKGVVTYTSRKKVRIILRSDSLMREAEWKGQVGIELIFDDRPYQVMKKSLKDILKSQDQHIQEWIKYLHEGHSKQYLLPPPENMTPSSDHLNEAQKETIAFCHRAERISIIHGPPGTGKTTTLVGLLTELLQYEKQVLVTAPSNNAVDLLTRLLDQKGHKVVRVGNVTRIGDGVAHLCLDEQIRQHTDWQHIKKVKIEAAQARHDAGKFKRKFGDEERKNRGLMYKEARQLENWARDLEDRLVQLVLDEAQVICTTLIGTANPLLEGRMVNTVVIDEASQSLEPECWVAMQKAKRVVLAGDHLQLPPTVKSHKAQQMGLATTILDRMKDSDCSRLLNQQYRMHPTILGFSNAQFYNGALHTAPQVHHRQSPFQAQPLVLIDTSGCGFEEQQQEPSQSKSKYNEQEYFMIREHMLLHREKYQDKSMGIIAPYAAQVKCISEHMESDESWQGLNVEVNTIDGFQGQEKSIIYLSLVRSNERQELGFLKDQRRLNVAMTRAQELLVIVGDISTLATDDHFAQLATHIEQNGLYQSAWEYMNME